MFAVATTQVVSQAKGSAYVERDKTKIICSVFDPREIPHQNEFRYLILAFKFKYLSRSDTFLHKTGSSTIRLVPSRQDGGSHLSLQGKIKAKLLMHSYWNL